MCSMGSSVWETVLECAATSCTMFASEDAKYSTIAGSEIAIFKFSRVEDSVSLYAFSSKGIRNGLSCDPMITLNGLPLNAA